MWQTNNGNNTEGRESIQVNPLSPSELLYYYVLLDLRILLKLLRNYSSTTD